MSTHFEQQNIRFLHRQIPDPYKYCAPAVSENKQHNNNMASSARGYLCIFLIFALFSCSKSRSISPSFVRGTDTVSFHILVDAAAQAFGPRHGMMTGSHFESKRASPGGPDPQHH